MGWMFLKGPARKVKRKRERGRFSIGVVFFGLLGKGLAYVLMI